jgi:hypothetical protein
VVAPRGELTAWQHCAMAAIGQAQLSCALVVHSGARDVRPRLFLTSEASTPGETVSRRVVEKDWSASADRSLRDSECGEVSDSLNVCRLFALRALLHFKGHLLIFLQ